MSTPSIISVHDGYVTFGKTPLFEELTVHIHPYERISLVGKNGAGKTTLMKILAQMRELDGGTYWSAPGVRVGYLQQDNHLENDDITIFDFIETGIAPENRNESYHYLIDIIGEKLDLPLQQTCGSLSGGQLRRAFLARAIVEPRDLLILDEPTNHLDIWAIQWLEEYLINYQGSLLCVSHDKRFLSKISNKVFWLDRGKIRVCPKGYGHFEQWSEELLDQEARELQNRKRALAIEVEWASRGVKARRKRNVQRLEKMKAERDSLKKDQSSYYQTTKKIELPPLEPQFASKLLCEFYRVHKSYTKYDGQQAPILDSLSFRLMRGDRIGIIGKNGSGKTSFLKLLIKQETPDKGSVKLNKNTEIAYFDQNRNDLKLDESLQKTLCPTGGEYIEVNGKARHVCGYLKDFMFDPKGAKDLVATLSGGQRNRLMLAKVLANPGNLLILDEPTNDLDMETLDMLEEILSQYKGTLIIVSHDRDFLDQTVSKIMAFEGNGNVQLHIGGYSDYEAKIQGNENQESPKKGPAKPQKLDKPKVQQKDSKKKISYKIQYEYDNLPKTIKQLESKVNTLNELMKDPELYQKNRDLFDKSAKELTQAKEKLEEAELRWLELDELINSES